MDRTITYRGFEISVILTPSSEGEDLYDVKMQVKGGEKLAIIGESGRAVMLRHGPFTARWAYLIGEVAGQAAIDLLFANAD
ncbi:hypothetical protein H3V53_00365 [Paraburkholderia bengalensis]|uniref:Uncharacterized protein n=1 Tax=Paraburkholderia bengalensis TaxID=2747562 RepID=A0ABU8IJB5_9BURK